MKDALKRKLKKLALGMRRTPMVKDLAVGVTDATLAGINQAAQGIAPPQYKGYDYAMKPSMILEFAVDPDQMDSRARGAAIGGALALAPGSLIGYGMGKAFGKNKKEKMSNRDKAMAIGGLLGWPGVAIGHVVAPKHEYARRGQILEFMISRSAGWLHKDIKMPEHLRKQFPEGYDPDKEGVTVASARAPGVGAHFARNQYKYAATAGGAIGGGIGGYYGHKIKIRGRSGNTKLGMMAGAIGGGLGGLWAGRGMDKRAEEQGAIKHAQAIGSMKRVAREHNLGAMRPGMIEFGLLGQKLKYGRPLIEEHPLPSSMAAYVAPASVRVGHKAAGIPSSAQQTPEMRQGRKHGVLVQSSRSGPDWQANLAGYKDHGEMRSALKRHELVHSIQSAKRGGRAHKKIRELIKDEIGAYSTMNRGVKTHGLLGKLNRGFNAVAGVGLSTAVGTATNPRLRKRAGKYAAVGAGLGAAGLLTRKVLKKKEPQFSEPQQFSAIRNALIEFETTKEAKEGKSQRSRAGDIAGMATYGAGAGAIAGAHTVSPGDFWKPFRDDVGDGTKGGYNYYKKSTDSRLGGSEDWKDAGNDVTEDAFQKHGKFTQKERSARAAANKLKMKGIKRVRNAKIGAILGAAGLGGLALRKPLPQRVSQEKKKGTAGADIGAMTGMLSGIVAGGQKFGPSGIMPGAIMGLLGGGYLGHKIGSVVGSRERRDK